MNKKTYDKLLKDYFSLNSPKETTAVKYTGVFNSIHIIIYFDAWDRENLNFQLILHNNTEYYLTTLNIKNNDFSSKYLNNISYTLLSCITIDNSLNEFYSKLEEIINNNNHILINYTKDKQYTNTCKYNPPKEELYLKTLSHKNMTDDMFNWARYNTNIELEKLKKIKRNNLTFVRTPDINKRRKLIVILDSFNIH
ncbi:hypothetical protein [Staphylococcus chromogenes]|uniref:hypothetical protein n=1 Tax=Staphylococcus chromogenes TaxID=46126 RepID=UPI00227B2A84|nr:hypothetical protein [Staphylococcus chromogenes]WAG30658.1 hypothetical protein LGV34_00270 [Staphylococcus chromogenes]